MQAVKSYPNATFSWVDLATTDADAAKIFYTQQFGWTYEDMPAGETGIYTMLKLEGYDVAALICHRFWLEHTHRRTIQLSYVSK